MIGIGFDRLLFSGEIEGLTDEGPLQPGVTLTASGPTDPPAFPPGPVPPSPRFCLDAPSPICCSSEAPPPVAVATVTSPARMVFLAQARASQYRCQAQASPAQKVRPISSATDLALQ